MLLFKKKFDKGVLEKKEYWLKMLLFHEKLIDYQKLIGTNKIVENIEISSEFLLITLNNGLKFVWDPHDLRSPTSVAINNGEYENEELAFISKILKNEKVVFDIGANVGWFSLHVSKFLNMQDSVVYSFEPVCKTFSVLNKNIEINKIKNIKTYKYAFGEREEKKVFFIPAVTGSVAASMANILEEECVKEECCVKRLDDFVQENLIEKIDFLKCDVEGAELFVIKGAFKTLKRLKPIIFIEMLRKWSAKFGYHPNDIISLLKKIDYQCYFLKNEQLFKIEKIENSTLNTNFFFLYNEKHMDIIQRYT